MWQGAGSGEQLSSFVYKRSSSVTKMAIYSAFALSYDFPHSFAGPYQKSYVENHNLVLNILDGVIFAVLELSLCLHYISL